MVYRLRFCNPEDDRKAVSIFVSLFRELLRVVDWVYSLKLDLFGRFTEF